MPESHLHDVSKLHEAFHWLLNSPAAFAMIVSVLFAWVVWWLRQVFVTRGALRELESRNTKEHAHIHGKIDQIAKDAAWTKGYLEKKNHD